MRMTLLGFESRAIRGYSQIVYVERGFVGLPGMPRAFNAHPNHPAVAYLLRLHADIGGQILENRKQAERLADDMRHVEAAIKMFDPGFDVRPWPSIGGSRIRGSGAGPSLGRP
jgi:hypothetical protein